MSTSGRSRAKELFRKATATILDEEYVYPTCFRIEVLEEALGIYNLELDRDRGREDSTDNEEDRPSPPPPHPLGKRPLTFWKNIAMISLHLAEALMEDDDDDDAEEDMVKDSGRIFSLVKDAIRYFTWNWLGRPEKREEVKWARKVMKAIYSAIDIAFQCLGQISAEDDWSKKLEDFAKEIQVDLDSSLDNFRLRLYSQRAGFYGRRAAELIEQNNFIQSSRVLENCRCDCDLAKRLTSILDTDTPSVTTLKQIEEIDAILKSLKSPSNSGKLHGAADELLGAALHSDPGEDNFGLSWDILDMFKAATMCAPTEEIVIETIATARGGLLKLFQKSFQGEADLNLFTSQADDLAKDLKVPEDLERWFWECVGLIGKFRKMVTKWVERPGSKRIGRDGGEPDPKRMRKNEDENEVGGKMGEEERAAYLEQLAEELRNLKGVEGCSFKLLKHIYANHPPKIDLAFNYDESQTSSDTIKKVLWRAIYHYHPDKQVAHDRKWQVLCSEIIKSLTIKYECMKSA